MHLTVLNIDVQANGSIVGEVEYKNIEFIDQRSFCPQKKSNRVLWYFLLSPNSTPRFFLFFLENENIIFQWFELLWKRHHKARLIWNSWLEKWTYSANISRKSQKLRGVTTCKKNRLSFWNYWGFKKTNFNFKTCNKKTNRQMEF